MLPLDEQNTFSGLFTLKSGEEIPGRLRLAGKDSSLLVWSCESLKFIKPGVPLTIYGTLENGRRVSLMECRPTAWRSINENHHSCRFIPRILLLGPKHCDPDRPQFTAIRFTLDDADSIFHKAPNMGILWNSQDIIEAINAKVGVQNTSIDPLSNWIAYYSGPAEVLSCDTIYGRVSVHIFAASRMEHKLMPEQPVSIEIEIALRKKSTILDALNPMLITAQFFGLIAGKQQEVDGIRVDVCGGHESRDTRLDLYLTLPTIRSSVGGCEDMSPLSLLIDPVTEQGQVSAVMQEWFERSEEQATALSRIFTDWGSNEYSIDRLVRVANAFELSVTPAAKKDSVPKKEIVKEAQYAIKNKFEQSAERDFVLTRLGWMVSQSSLADKIMARAKVVEEFMPRQMQDMKDVIKAAVRCRNHFVHGSLRGEKDRNCANCAMYFARTLEFIFLSSELVHCGWNMGSWMRKKVKGWHSFVGYMATYADIRRKCV